jgi:hypothetical protein
MKFLHHPRDKERIIRFAFQGLGLSIDGQQQAKTKYWKFWHSHDYSK